jgi:hypothetical protein
MRENVEIIFRQLLAKSRQLNVAGSLLFRPGDACCDPSAQHVLMNARSLYGLEDPQILTPRYLTNLTASTLKLGRCEESSSHLTSLKSSSY